MKCDSFILISVCDETALISHQPLTNVNVTVSISAPSVLEFADESVISATQSSSWCVCPCRAKGRGWGWPPSWLSARPVLVYYPEAGRAPPPRHSVEGWLPSVSPWTDSFPSVSWMVISALSWRGTLGVWDVLNEAGREVKESWVLTLADWEETRRERSDAPHAHLSPLLSHPEALALSLPVHPGCAAVWTSLFFALMKTSPPDLPLSCPASCPRSRFPFYFPPLPSPRLSDCLSPCYSLDCTAWLSVGSSCGGQPHLCRSCAGWWCWPLCWHRSSVMTRIPTSSSDWSFGTLSLLQLERGRKVFFIQHETRGGWRFNLQVSLKKLNSV